MQTRTTDKPFNITKKQVYGAYKSGQIQSSATVQTPLPRARARERVVPISELVFGALTQNWSNLEPPLGFAAAIARHAAH
jgi:hypothetical protein